MTFVKLQGLLAVFVLMVHSSLLVIASALVCTGVLCSKAASQFKPHPSYWIPFGEYSENELVNQILPSEPQKLPDQFNPLSFNVGAQKLLYISLYRILKRNDEHYIAHELKQLTRSRKADKQIELFKMALNVIAYGSLDANESLVMGAAVLVPLLEFVDKKDIEKLARLVIKGLSSDNYGEVRQMVELLRVLQTFFYGKQDDLPHVKLALSRELRKYLVSGKGGAFFVRLFERARNCVLKNECNWKKVKNEYCKKL